MDRVSPQLVAPPTHAMILAAGRGERLRPITDQIPKPMVTVEGQTLLDHLIDRLRAYGIQEIVVNAHYRADQIVTHLADYTAPPVRVIVEADALETGGGVLNALPTLGQGAFFTLNGDALYYDRDVPALTRLAGAFDPALYDAVLLLMPRDRAIGYEGRGDFHRDDAGRLRHRTGDEIAPYIYAGVQLIHPRAFAAARPGRFSLLEIWLDLARRGRLGSVVHTGDWYHVSTPAGLEAVRALVRCHHPAPPPSTRP